ncbi:MAG: NAD(P)H-hydrate dehydratase [Gemmatimonadota bacterium]
MRFLSPEGMRVVDRRTIEGGTSGGRLMAAAGRAVAEETWRAFPDPGLSVLALCGTGHNGGDGFVAARELLGRYRRVRVALAGEPAGLRGDASAAAEDYRGAGGEVRRVRSAGELRGLLEHSDVLVDALLGTGVAGELRDLPRELLEAACGFAGGVVAVDAPSGLDLATGTLLGPVPRADLTVTFGAAKLGHVLGAGPDVSGRIVVRAIGLDADALADAAGAPDSARALSFREAERLLPLPGRRAHKRDAGVVVVVAGSRAYSGAAVLACRGASLAGAGLVHALVPACLKSPLTAAHPEIIAAALPEEADGSLGAGAERPLREALEKARPDAVVLGPGLGGADGTRGLVRGLLRSLSAGEGAADGQTRSGARAGGAGGPALLLDADALNAFAGERHRIADAARRTRLAMTPHPGELGRLLQMPAREVDRRRVDLARQVAGELGCAVLLKGVPTVVCGPDARTLLNLTGNAALARGGTGDLLSGIAGTFLAKGLQALDALGLGAFVQGLAGDLARARLGTLSATAGEIARDLPRALRALERGSTAALARRLGTSYAELLEEPPVNEDEG